MSSRRPVRIATWSGPRNISTAMMRAWENRADTAVVDEPFYAYYLQATAADHPLRDAVIAAGETDWRRVVASLIGPVPDDRPVFYQKHMTHHLLPEVGRSWLAGAVNCFLIRDPAEVAVSYAKVRGEPRAQDLGMQQQAAIFAEVRRLTGTTPLVIDAADVLRDPEALLRAWCDRLEIAFDESMLHWPAGPRPSDGVWAPHWYDNVRRSTGFAPYRVRPERVPGHLAAVIDACRPHYEELAAHRLVP